jgi:hypothetical protein
LFKFIRPNKTGGIGMVAEYKQNKDNMNNVRHDTSIIFRNKKGISKRQN